MTSWDKSNNSRATNFRIREIDVAPGDFGEVLRSGGPWRHLPQCRRVATRYDKLAAH